MIKFRLSNYLSPGVHLIFTFLLQVSLPSYLLFRTVQHCFPTIDRHLGWGCYTVLGSLLVFLLHIVYTHLQTSYHLVRARQLNAEMIPSMSGRWPGNLDVLKSGMRVWKTGYPGDIAGRIMKELAGNSKLEGEGEGERNVETYAVKMCWKNTVFTCDPEIVKDILTNDFSNYIKGTSMTDALRSVLGSGVFNTNGDLWRFHRSMSRPFFTRDRLRDIIPVFVRHADRALDLVTRRNDAGLEGLATIDVQDLASRLTLDATTEFLFGSCVNSLEEELPRPWNDTTEASSPSPCTTSPSSLSVDKEDTSSPSSTLGSSKLSKNPDKSSPPTPKRSNSQESILPITSSPTTSQADPKPPAFPSAFTSALHTLASRLRLGSLWPLLEIRRDGTGKDVKIIREFVSGIVKRALERREEKERLEGQRYSADEKPEVVEKGETLLDHLVTVSDDHQLIQDELINILIAGRDTTASCMTFATYLLSQHPSVLRRLSEEVSSVLENSPSSSPTDEHPTTNHSSKSSRAPGLEDLRKMPYLRAVINETLRLFPSVPLNVRDNVHERVWTASDGSGKRWYLPAGTSITYSLLHIHRSPRLWGPTAAQFDPARFLPEDPRYMQYYAKTPYVFMPFNAGPRSCLGQQVAIAEVGVWLVRLVQRLQESKAMHDATSPFYAGEKGEKAGGRGGWDAMVQLDEDAIPLAARVPPSWKEEGKAWQNSLASSDSWNTDLEGGRAYEKSSSPLDTNSQHDNDHHHHHHDGGDGERQPLLASSGGARGDAWLPSETPTGVSPRRAIEKVWPKSHLTMFIEGGLWMRLAL